MLSGIPSHVVRNRILFPVDQPETDLDSLESLQINLGQQLLPEIPISERQTGSVTPIALSPFGNAIGDAFNQIDAVCGGDGILMTGRRELKQGSGPRCI
jgi:hypothetical protein